MESFFSRMNFQMFVQIGFLCEAESTILEGARVRLLVGMDPQVVKEIVPFSEILVTSIFFAFEDLDLTLGFGVLE